ncbi:hypothetical protein BSKO_08343 [Bryopsis sp. KO-2023]|nr:hypothetical protein BSKO_08343 [Bryopsis sp. KO-2023]
MNVTPLQSTIEEQGNEHFEEISTILKMFPAPSSSSTTSSSTSHSTTPFGRSPKGEPWKWMPSRRIFEPINHKPSEMDLLHGRHADKARVGLPRHASKMGECDFEDWNREDFGHTIAMKAGRRSCRNLSALSLALSRRTHSLDVELGGDSGLLPSWGASMVGEPRRSHSMGEEVIAPVKKTSLGFPQHKGKAAHPVFSGSSLLGVSELGIANASDVWLSTAKTERGEAVVPKSDRESQEEEEEEQTEGFVDRHGVRWVGDCSFLEVMRSKKETSGRESVENEQTRGDASVKEEPIKGGLHKIRIAIKRTTSERIIRTSDKGFSGSWFNHAEQKRPGLGKEENRGGCEGQVDLEYSSAGESDESKIRVPSPLATIGAARQLKRVMSCPGRSCWEACSGYTKRTREKHCQVWGIKQFCDSGDSKNKNEVDDTHPTGSFGKERNNDGCHLGSGSERVPIFETAWEEEYPLECQPPCSEEGDRSMDDLGDTFQSNLLDFWPSDMSLCDEDHREEEFHGSLFEGSLTSEDTLSGEHGGKDIATHSDFGNDHCRGEMYDMDNLGQIGAFRSSPRTIDDNNCLVEALSNKVSVDSELSGVESGKVVEESFQKEKEEKSRGVRDKHGVLWVGECDIPSMLMGSHQGGKLAKQHTKKPVGNAPDTILRAPLVGKKMPTGEKSSALVLGISSASCFTSRLNLEILDSAECHKRPCDSGPHSVFPQKQLVEDSLAAGQKGKRDLVGGGGMTDGGSGNRRPGPKAGAGREDSSLGFFQLGGDGGCPASWSGSDPVGHSLGCRNAGGSRNRRLDGAEDGDFRASAPLGTGDGGVPVGLTALESCSTHRKLDKEGFSDSGKESGCGGKHPQDGGSGATWSLGVFTNPREKSTQHQELCKTKSLCRRLLEYCSESLQNGVGSSCRNLGSSIWEYTSRKKGAGHQWGGSSEKNPPRSVVQCMADPPFLIRF